MAVSQLAWIHAVPTLLTVLFLLFAIVYVSRKQSDRTRAKALVLWSLAILLTIRIGMIAFNVTVAALVPASALSLYIGLFSIATSVFYIAALSLLIAAALTNRPALVAESEPWEPSSPPTNTSGNPYSPPSN